MKQPIAPDNLQPKSFEFSDQKAVKAILAKYPNEKETQKSATMPLLDLAQRQMASEAKKGGGWIPRAAMDKIAEILSMPPIRVYEVATFYSMFHLAPMGKHHIQVCGTTPCWLRGSAGIQKACEKHLKIHDGETTDDQMFTLSEVECLGACVNAPMVQINDDYFEDLTPERMVEILDLLKKGKDVPKGSQTGRQTSKAAQA